MSAVDRNGVVINDTVRLDEPGKCLFVSYVGIGACGKEAQRYADAPVGHQYFGSIIVDCSAPKTWSDCVILEEWLRDFELPQRGRPSYSQLAILNWKELDRD